MQPTTFDLTTMTPDELRAEIDRRIVEPLQAVIDEEDAKEVDRILYGDPDAPKPKFRKRRLKGSQLIVKEATDDSIVR